MVLFFKVANMATEKYASIIAILDENKNKEYEIKNAEEITLSSSGVFVDLTLKEGKLEEEEENSTASVFQERRYLGQSSCDWSLLVSNGKQ